MDTDKTNNEIVSQNKRKFNIGYLFGAVMIVVYFGMAYLLLFSGIFSETFSPILRYSFGAVFAIYGIFRAYRFIKSGGYR